MVEIFSFGSHSKIVQWHVIVHVLRVTKRFCMQTKFSKCQIQKKKLKRGPSLKENSGLNRVPGYATFGIVKVDYPGPWVFYLALSIIALPKSLRLFLKEIDRHRPCNREQRHLSFQRPRWPLLGVCWDFVGLITSPLSGQWRDIICHFMHTSSYLEVHLSSEGWCDDFFASGRRFRQPEPKTCY